jgi:hypothetical protein
MSYWGLDLPNIASENTEINPKKTEKTSDANDRLGFTQKGQRNPHLSVTVRQASQIGRSEKRTAAQL